VNTNERAEGDFPYSFKLVYVGFFRVVKDFPADRIEQMVRVNGPALLYSAAREALVYLSGRGRRPAIMLPSITFIEPPRIAKSHPPRKIAKKK
jgi:preprotein translocase subunit SecB